MNQTTANDSTLRNDGEIDFREILMLLWRKKHWVLISAFLFLSLSAFYAYYVAKPVYDSTALLIPTQSSATNELGAAATLVGKASLANNDIDLYQGLLTSRTVISKLLKEPMANNSDTGNGRMEPLLSILGLGNADQKTIDNVVESFAHSVSVGAKGGEGGIIKIQFTANSPWLAQQLGENALKIGQEEFRTVRIERSKIIIARLNLAVASASSEWESAARALANYKDRNRAISLPDQIMALSKLEIEKQAKEQKFLLVRKELETQILDQAKAVPPMMILDPPNYPSKKSKPKRGTIMAAGLILGFIFGCGSILAFKAFSRETA